MFPNKGAIENQTWRNARHTVLAGDIAGHTVDYYLKQFPRVYKELACHNAIEFITYYQLRSLREPKESEFFSRLGLIYELIDNRFLSLCCYIKAYELGSQDDSLLAEKVDQLSRWMDNSQRTLSSYQCHTYPVSVSVIMPTYNRLESIRDSIESVLNQTLQDFELIVINDGGLEEIVRIVDSYQCDKIRYYRIENKGLAGARNEGLTKARGQYIAYLDDDDIFYANHLEILLNHILAHKCDFVYSNCWRVYGTVEGCRFKPDHRELIDWRPKRFSIAKLFQRNFISILNVLHKRECAEALGGFNENLGKLEDWDFGIRIAQRYRICGLNEITGEYRKQEDNMSVNHNLEMQFLEMLLGHYYSSMYAYPKLVRFHVEQSRNDKALEYLDKINLALKHDFPLVNTLPNQLLRIYSWAFRNRYIALDHVGPFMKVLLQVARLIVTKAKKEVKCVLDRHILWRFKRINHGQ